jgi:hypothetical protein
MNSFYLPFIFRFIYIYKQEEINHGMIYFIIEFFN